MSIDAQQQLHLLLDAAAKGLLPLGTAMHKHDGVRNVQGCIAGPVWQSTASMLAWKPPVTKCASCCLPSGSYFLLLTLLLLTSFVVSFPEHQLSDDHDLHGVNLHGDRDASLHDDDDDDDDDDASLHDDDDANLRDACRQR